MLVAFRAIEKRRAVLLATQGNGTMRRGGMTVLIVALESFLAHTVQLRASIVYMACMLLGKVCLPVLDASLADSNRSLVKCFAHLARKDDFKVKRFVNNLLRRSQQVV